MKKTLLQCTLHIVVCFFIFIPILSTSSHRFIDKQQIKQWELVLEPSKLAMHKLIPAKYFTKSDKFRRTTQKASVYKTGKTTYEIKNNTMDKNALVYGYYQISLLQTGWDILEIKTGNNTNFSDQDLMYAAGLLEGYLTGDKITENYKNLFPTFFGGDNIKLLNKTRVWLNVQYDWAVKYSMTHSDDSFGRFLGYIMSQLDGLTEGYFRSNTSIPKDPFVTRMLNAVGDLLDLMDSFKPKTDFNKMTNNQFADYVRKSGRCSALIKATGAYENLFMAHSSWFVYQATLRIYKHYDFQLKDTSTSARKVSFSSYPGFLESLDDFYIMDNGMVMLQTTNNVFNTTLYDFVVPDSVLAWQRVRIANHVAQNGSQWAQLVSKENSGTYNNQYMVIDLNKIKLNESINDGALTIVEQIPTLVEYSDQTAILRAGYWPSYNVPFHETIYNLSGYPETVKKRGLDFSYQMAPRAKIFRRDANSVTNMEKFKAIMRYNDYQNDPYSDKNPYSAICSRGDLLKPEDASPNGCYDSKVTDFASAKKLKSWAINGPTRGNNMNSLPPFQWQQFLNTSHEGLPDIYNFNWVEMSPSNI